MISSLRILLLEDSEDDALFLIRHLRRYGIKIDHRRVDTLAGLEEALRDGDQWDLIISDYTLPTCGALEALEIWKREAPDLPFMIVSGSIEEEQALAAMNAGAHDFFSKDKLVLLIPSIERELRDARGRRERQRAEAALRSTYLDLQSMIQASPTAIILVDAHGLVQNWNPAAERIFGWRGNQVIGRPSPIVPPEYEAEERENLRRLMEGEVVITSDTRRRNQDGSLVDVHLSASALLDPVGRFRGTIQFLVDMTTQKALESQLRQSQKMEALGQLAGGVAHDFNNLLQVIMGYAELTCISHANDESLGRDVQEILRAGTRASELTRQLLAFGRRQILQPQHLDLNAVIENFLNMLGRVIGSKYCVQCIPGEGLGTIYADPGQIEQVLMNLCVNARDAMPEGGMLTIETSNVRPDQSYRAIYPWIAEGWFVRLDVTDTGIGIDDANQSHIFEPFYTTKGQSGGTGLGLSTAYGIVKQHQGFIQVSSELNKGTTFSIYLPIIDGEPISQPRCVEATIHGGSETILLAEDDKPIRELAERILRDAGYDVITACDGEQALHRFVQAEDRIDLVILDVVMPKLPGRVAYEEMRRLHPDLKIIFCSGYSANGAETDFITGDEVTLLQKPYGRHDLLRKVRESLNSRDVKPGYAKRPQPIHKIA